MPWFSRIFLRNPEDSASFSEDPPRDASEKGENGHGSTLPSGLMCTKPRPAARQPPSSTSPAGKARKRAGKESFSDLTIAFSFAF